MERETGFEPATLCLGSTIRGQGQGLEGETLATDHEDDALFGQGCCRAIRMVAVAESAPHRDPTRGGGVPSPGRPACGTRCCVSAGALVLSHDRSFTVSCEGDVYYWEHLGMFAVPEYRERWERKRQR